MIRCRVISPSVKNRKVGDYIFLDAATVQTLSGFIEEAPLAESVPDIISSRKVILEEDTNDDPVFDLPLSAQPKPAHQKKRKR